MSTTRNDELFTTASNSFYELDTKVNEDGYTYGVVHIVTPEVKLIEKPLAIVFTVDKSGSMAETDSRGQTKMAYVKHTLKNIFRYFVLRQEEYNHFHVNVNIIGFDDNITQITKGLEEFIHTHHVRFRFSARVDILTKDTLWELKCTSQLSIEHMLQLILYAWIYE